MSIEVNNLSWEIEGKSIISNISLRIDEGEILTVIGPNGAGKSSFMKLLSGDIDTYFGEIYFNGTLLDDISIQERSFIRSVMSQSQEIVYDYSVKEIIEMGWLNRGLSNYSKDFDEAIQKIAIECSVENHLEQSTLARPCYILFLQSKIHQIFLIIHSRSHLIY